MPPPDRCRWWWRRRRAAHYVWRHMCDWIADPTPANRAAYLRALDYQHHVWAAWAARP